MVKECKICKVAKSEEEFFTCGRYKDKIYRRGECNECHNSCRIGKNLEYHREYRQRPEVKERRKLKRRMAEYRKTDRIREKRKYATDPVFRLKKCMRSRISRALKSKRWAKNNKTEQYLGCKYQELKQYLESQFHSGMTWENHGILWEVDHIEPIGKALTIEEIYKLSHYTNLRPFLNEEHDIKSKKDTTNIAFIKKEVKSNS